MSPTPDASDALDVGTATIAPPFATELVFPDVEPSELAVEETYPADRSSPWRAYMLRVLPGAMLDHEARTI